MKRKIVFLLNPIAGNGNRSNIRQLIEKKATAQKIEFVMLPTNAQGRYDEVRKKINEEQFTDVVVAGGDGTINAVVNNLRDTGVHFGLIPCGSGNGLALCAGISKNSAKAIDLIFTGKPMLIDAFLINHHFSCMLSGLGFDAQVAHDFAKQNKRGLITYVKQTYANFLKAKPFKFEISVNDKSVSTNAFFISIANSNQFGNQVTIAPKASLTDGLLDIVIVQEMNKLQMLLAVMNQINKGEVKEKLYKEKGVIYYQTPHLTIRNIDNAPLHIDGDPKDTANLFDIKVIPGAFSLIQPLPA
ncbi:MAG: YegS/Rv2252/BmrU family lipid kinase [Agriterribacter sp.]